MIVGQHYYSTLSYLNNTNLCAAFEIRKIFGFGNDSSPAHLLTRALAFHTRVGLRSVDDESGRTMC